MKSSKLFRKLTTLITIIGFVVVITPSTEAQAATTSADASATIVTPLAIVKVTDLLFGKLTAGGAGGTITMTPAGVRTAGGGVTLFTQGNISNAASFTVNGEGTLTYAITLPPSDVTLISGSDSMTVNTFSSDPSGTGTLAAGTQTLSVGATLNVAANQPAGNYTGNFNVIVDYN